MSKKLEVVSCKKCQHLKFSHNLCDYICEAFGDENSENVTRISVHTMDADEIANICPLEDYHAEEYDFKSSVPVINRHALKAAYGLRERGSLREEYENHVSTPEPVAPAVVEMKELVAMIEYSAYTEYYHSSDGNSHQNHPSKVNEFIHRVGESGGNIISVQHIPERSMAIHYSVPVGTYPISV